MACPARSVLGIKDPAVCVTGPTPVHSQQACRSKSSITACQASHRMSLESDARAASTLLLTRLAYVSMRSALRRRARARTQCTWSWILLTHIPPMQGLTYDGGNKWRVRLSYNGKQQVGFQEDLCCSKQEHDVVIGLMRSMTRTQLCFMCVSCNAARGPIQRCQKGCTGI